MYYQAKVLIRQMVTPIRNRAVIALIRGVKPGGYYEWLIHETAFKSLKMIATMYLQNYVYPLVMTNKLQKINIYSVLSIKT